MNQKDIFIKLADAAYESVKHLRRWDKSILKIKRLEGNVGFESFYTLNDEIELPVDTHATYQTSKAVHQLHKLMSETFDQNSKWNRLIFTLFSDNRIKTEYIWDQELQDEVDGYNEGK